MLAEPDADQQKATWLLRHTVAISAIACSTPVAGRLEGREPEAERRTCLFAILKIATAYVSIGVQRQCRYGVLPPAAGVLRYISTSSSRISLSGSTSVSVPSNANVSNLCSVSE
jgi:hypothetical protein